MSKYGHRSINWFEAIVNKIGGEDAADRFLRDELVVRTAEKFFPVWKTLTLGRLASVVIYRAALKANGYPVGDYASQMLDKVVVAAAETEVDLVNVSVAELGFKDGATYEAICTRAKEFGLNRCPAEVGPKLRLEYTDQPYGEWLRIAMEPITDSGGYLYIFGVDYDCGDRWLYGDGGDPDFFWDGSFRFVFVRPRK